MSNGLHQSPFGEEKNDIKGLDAFFSGAQKYVRKAVLLK